jgi:hypothetical protein
MATLAIHTVLGGHLLYVGERGTSTHFLVTFPFNPIWRAWLAVQAKERTGHDQPGSQG